MKSQKIATGGLISALSLLFLYLCSVVPSGKIAMICISSFCIGLCVALINIRFSVVAYIAVSILGLILLPNKIIPLLFILFFGNYPVAKLFLEKITNTYLMWLVKIIVFNIYAVVTYFMVTRFIDVEINFAVPIIILIANFAYVIYDFAFSIFVTKILEIRRKKL